MFDEIDGTERENGVTDVGETRTLGVNYNIEARWLRGLENDLSGVYEQEDMDIKKQRIRAKMKKMLNWKCSDSGPNREQGY